MTRRRYPSADRTGLLATEVNESVKKFRVIFSSIRAHSRAIESACGMSASHLWALAEVSKRPGLRVSDLTAALQVHQSTASNLLDELEHRGFVTRARAATDRRVVTISITRKGKGILDRAPRPAIGLLPDALRRLPATSLRELNELLEALVHAMNQTDARGAWTPLTDG
jgi:DNA-binding MarR family transcriptional regulator